MSALVADVGTSSMRGIVYDERGVRLAEHQVRYAPIYHTAEVAEQEPASFERALCEVCRVARREAAEGGHETELVALTSQRSSIAAVDAEGRPLTPFIMWQDTRNAELVDELSQSGDLVFSLNGTRVNTVFSGGKMAWVEREMPEVAERCHKYVTIPEYLIHVMTGSWVTDETYASRSSLMNIRTRRWDSELLGIFGVAREKLCDIVSPGEVVGCVGTEFATRTGLREGVPVVSSGGDQQCAAVGQGVVAPGTVSVATGTGAFLETAIDAVPDDLASDVICNASCLAGLYTLEASVLACCSAFDWFRRELCPDMGFDDIARVLETEHASCEACVVLPYFQGRGTSDWNAGATATLHGLSLSTTRDNLLYSLLLGVFIEVRNNLDSIERYVPLTRGSVSGGLTQAPVINQMQADAYDFPLARLDDFEATARGALVSALVGQGVYPDAARAYQGIVGDGNLELFEPDAGRHERIEALRARATGLYQRIYQ